MNWVKYDWNKPETRPKKYGKYFIHRKDGKTHWETWNGSGWAYNGNVITYWTEIEPPGKVSQSEINLLDRYTKFLQENGYMDLDATCEQPFALDEFLKLENGQR